MNNVINFIEYLTYETKKNDKRKANLIALKMIQSLENEGIKLSGEQKKIILHKFQEAFEKGQNEILRTLM